MKIYLDYLFLENLLITLILIIETKMISKTSLKNINAIIAGLMSAIYVVLMMFLKIQALNMFVAKIILSIAIVYLAFKPKTLKTQIKLVCIYYLVSIINLGAVIFVKSMFDLKSNYLSNLIIYFVGFILSYFSIKYMWKIYKNNIKNQELLYDVTINILDKKYKYKAFLDTGNNVYSYEMKVPIVFAEYLDKEIKDLQKAQKQFIVETNTFSKANRWTAYFFENVEISNSEIKQKCKVGIVFVDHELNKNYNMVLNYNLFEENLGGIKI